MDEIGFDFNQAVQWFSHAQDDPYVLIHVSENSVAQLLTAIGVPLRRCYIADEAIKQSVARSGSSAREVVCRVLPDPGAVMSGDFGEVLTYFYQSVRALPNEAIGVKKWRLKQDRTKPAPKSDVVHFVVPAWPTASEDDVVLCAEVKAKATPGDSKPIESAIRDCKKDRVSRLASTLVWLRERATIADLGDVDIPLLSRFIDAVDGASPVKCFSAVAVVDDALLANELAYAPDAADSEFTLVLIGVPALRATYTAAYDAASTAAV